MPCIYETVNLHNKSQNIFPWRYIGSDQHDRAKYFGSNKALEKDIENLGEDCFVKTVIRHFDKIDNKNLRCLESQYLKNIDARTDPTYYNKNNNYAPGCGVKGMKHHQKKIVSDAWKQSRRGWCPSQETRCLWSQQRIGKSPGKETRKIWAKQRSGAGNPNALEWTLTSPDGHTFKVTGLRNYCKEHNLSYEQLRNNRGGWKTIKHGQGKGGRKAWI